MAYRINYLDSAQSPQLIAVAETLADAHSAMRYVGTSLPEQADRLQIAEDPLLGTDTRVVQPPESLDTPGGLSVLYLGGTISPDRNWQAEAVTALIAHPVVITNPRREQPTSSDDEVLVQVAWQRRHLWRCDMAMFWFEGSDADPSALVELGTQIANPVPLAVGISPEYPQALAVRALVGHSLTEQAVQENLAGTIACAVDLIRKEAKPPLRLPYHNGDPGISALALQLKIAAMREGTPGLPMAMNELAIEATCAVDKGLDPCLLVRIHAGLDRLRADPADPLGWAELMDIVHALGSY
ncbi:nucleoside 2-deoxyribosyltransferase domain-containing protein [Micromonospora sp. WMMD1082]|uniref:nucleoside 2-deoxyribosyltransferase domain-containing protein n=1 Tax=Micromonospora sp. WMMD1082 TaxID=3016104 RepID=UPI0024168F27|nr:nucleoside 2-deoxyribosyltransferase domain-containing protein [Micromonospora sp. WMMD1082]MDG4793628.1 nucleoside 2-deoxyribosyltransferase domain-containing protein [Micromonospora sp. WMMD1082]